MQLTSPVKTRAGRCLAVTVAALGLATLSVPVHAEGTTLKVFGGSSLDQLAPRQAPEDQARIQKQVFDGFIADNPDVDAIEWDAQGPQANAIERLMTARLAEQEMDLIACPAFYTNGAYVRRGLVKPITDEIKPFQDRIDAAALGKFGRNTRPGASPDNRGSLGDLLAQPRQGRVT